MSGKISAGSDGATSIRLRRSDFGHFREHLKYQVPKHKQIPPTGVSGETMSKLPNPKRDTPGFSGFESLVIRILNLFDIWLLSFGALISFSICFLLLALNEPLLGNLFSYPEHDASCPE